VIWFTTVGVLIFVIGYVVLSRLRRREPTFKIQRKMSGIHMLSLDAARAMVDEIVTAGEQLIREPAGRTDVNVDFLGPVTKEFFAKYNGLRTKQGGFAVGIGEVHVSEYAVGFISIGHSEDWDIVQRPGDDEVLVVEGAEITDSERDARFPTIYHLIADEAQRT
jgi:hypothetical protein